MRGDYNFRKDYLELRSNYRDLDDVSESDILKKLDEESDKLVEACSAIWPDG